MKKTLLILTFILLLCLKANAADNNIALLTKQGFFDRPSQHSFLPPCEEVKKVLNSHLYYANSYNFDALKSLYSPNFVNSDGLNKEIYFDLIKKTWETYPDIKYKSVIKNISISGDIAVAQVSECAEALTSAASGVVKDKGLLQSSSDSVYYLEKINNEWKITSDRIIFEKTSLKYGTAKEICTELSAPAQIASNTQYTASLNIKSPKDALVIASVGQENITYPQTTAPEVFRKMPQDNILERIFTSNNKDLNEYAVASFGVTKAEVQGTDVRVYVTGLGFLMSRVNVIPQNNFVKAATDEQTK